MVALDNTDRARFTLRLEDPGSTDDQVAATFAAFLAQDLAQRVPLSGAAALDLQRSVPEADQPAAMGLTARPRVITFLRYLEGQAQGVSFVRSV